MAVIARKVYLGRHDSLAWMVVGRALVESCVFHTFGSNWTVPPRTPDFGSQSTNRLGSARGEEHSYPSFAHVNTSRVAGVLCGAASRGLVTRRLRPRFRTQRIHTDFMRGHLRVKFTAARTWPNWLIATPAGLFVASVLAPSPYRGRGLHRQQTGPLWSQSRLAFAFGSFWTEMIPMQRARYLPVSTRSKPSRLDRPHVLERTPLRLDRHFVISRSSNILRRSPSAQGR